MPLNLIKNWLYNSELVKKLTYAGSTAEVGIYLEDAENCQIDSLTTILKKSGYSEDQIHLLRFLRKKELTPGDDHAYSLKEITWSGFPNSDEVSKFLSKKYKKFFYLCPSYEKHQQFILSKINADFKAGVFHKGIESKLDLTIDHQFHSASQSLRDINQLINHLTNKK